MVSTDIDQSLSEVIAPGAHAAQARSNAPLFILSFVFLLFVLLVNGWQEWRNSIENYQADAKRTVNDYVMQSSIVLKAGIHANRIFIRSYGESLTAFALQPNTINSEELRQHIAAAIFNYTGFFVFSNENVLLNHDGELLHDNEPEAIKTILSQPDKQTQIFSLRFGEQGGYYIAT
ncbi:MAG: hypothetical protein P1U57_12260, partial [Oleibacter sp.]|nr:hypothetical protein [Thalassolituus sp.]